MLIFITGASAGFGSAAARKFVQEGHEVILLARREEKLKQLQEELGRKCVKIIAQDASNTHAISLVLGDLAKEVDVLINNAGLALGIESAHSCDIKDWEQMIHTNILALVRLSHFFAPLMVARKKGHIINIGSIAGSYPYPGGNVYGATKAFVKQFSLGLRADFYDKNIRVTNIEPGLAGGSEFSLVRFKGDATRAENLYQNAHPLLPEDVAEAIFWAASLPEHVNINRIELMPTTQAPAALNVFRG